MSCRSTTCFTSDNRSKMSCTPMSLISRLKPLLERRDIFRDAFGTTVPDIRPGKKGQEHLYPSFATWREQIDGKYWFPTYTRADDTLHFTTGDIRIREI